MKKFRVGIDNYGLYPLNQDPFETLKWAEDHGAEGVHFSGFSHDFDGKMDSSFFKDLAQYASERDLYIEWGGGQHIPFDTKTWKEKEVMAANQKAANQASILGTRIVRSCSGGLMRWHSGTPMTETLIHKMADSLRSQRQMLIDHNVILAIETHFEFTSYELIRLFELCDAEPGEYLGICLDTMNLFTMLEDPLTATLRLLPWVVATHIKDGALMLDNDGLISFPVQMGEGLVDLKKIILLISTLSRDIHLSVEDHGGSISIPIFDHIFLSKFPDLTSQELSNLLKLSRETEKLMHAGTISIVPTAEWPLKCNTRMKQGIQILKKIVSNCT